MESAEALIIQVIKAITNLDLQTILLTLGIDSIILQISQTELIRQFGLAITMMKLQNTDLKSQLLVQLNLSPDL